MSNADVPIWEKYTLTIEEASKYFRTMTLNYYAHATFASARAEMERLIAA